MLLFSLLLQGSPPPLLLLPLSLDLEARSKKADPNLPAPPSQILVTFGDRQGKWQRALWLVAPKPKAEVVSPDERKQ